MRPIGLFTARSQVLSSLFTITFLALVCSPVYAGASSATNQSGASTYAYVGSSPSSGSGYISGFAIAADGSAQPVSGSPFPGASNSVVGSPNYVFATDGSNIVTYTVGSDGSLAQTSSVNGKAYDLDRGSSGVGGLSLSPDNRISTPTSGTGTERTTSTWHGRRLRTDSFRIRLHLDCLLIPPQAPFPSRIRPTAVMPTHGASAVKTVPCGAMRAGRMVR